MQNILQQKTPQLRISHQSEVLILRQQLADLQAEMMKIKQQMNHTKVSPLPRKIMLSSNGQHHLIELDDIIYCEADGNYTKVFIQQENTSLAELSAERSRSRSRSQHFLISKTLKSTISLINSDDLPADELALQAGFIRCHQSYLINKKHVVSYENKNGCHLTMSDEKSIPVSRRNKKIMLTAMF